VLSSFLGDSTRAKKPRRNSPRATRQPSIAENESRRAASKIEAGEKIVIVVTDKKRDVTLSGSRRKK
jgi:hypothetical protein